MLNKVMCDGPFGCTEGSCHIGDYRCTVGSLGWLGGCAFVRRFYRCIRTRVIRGRGIVVRYRIQMCLLTSTRFPCAFGVVGLAEPTQGTHGQVNIDCGCGFVGCFVDVHTWCGLFENLLFMSVILVSCQLLEGVHTWCGLWV